MRVILEPLIGDVPIVGAVSMFFIRRPVGPFEDIFLFFLFPTAPFTHIAEAIVFLNLVLTLYGDIDFESVLIDFLCSSFQFLPRN